MTFSSLHTYDHYGYAAFAVLGTLLVVVLIHLAMTRSPWRERVASLAGVAPPFINVIGVLFGLTLAFLANDTWNAHDRATTSVHREADALRSLTVLSFHLEGALGAELRRQLEGYAQAAGAEWPQLAHRRVGAEVTDRADALLRLLSSRDIASAAGDNVQALMLREATSLRDERDLRISLSQTHINPLKWLGMAFLGFLTLLSIAVAHAAQPRAALVAIVLFALAAAPTAAIVLVQGNPFQEPSAVSAEPILAAGRALAEACRDGSAGACLTPGSTPGGLPAAAR